MFINNIVLNLEFVSLEKIECLFFLSMIRFRMHLNLSLTSTKEHFVLTKQKNSNAILLFVNTLHFIHSNDLGQKTKRTQFICQNRKNKF